MCQGSPCPSVRPSPANHFLRPVALPAHPRKPPSLDKTARIPTHKLDSFFGGQATSTDSPLHLPHIIPPKRFLFIITPKNQRIDREVVGRLSSPQPSPPYATSTLGIVPGLRTGVLRNMPASFLKLGPECSRNTACVFLGMAMGMDDNADLGIDKGRVLEVGWA